MSAEQLQAVAKSSWIESHPTVDALADLYVPFSTLTGATDPEADLASAIEQRRRVGIYGPAGCGKSSLVQYVLAHGKDLAPITINVANEDPEVVTEPRAFFGLIAGQLVKGAKRAEAISESKAEELQTATGDTTPLPAKTRTVSGSAGVNAWLFDATLGGDIQKTLDLPDTRNSFEDIAQATIDALELIREAKLSPVLVADDADRLLRLPDKEQAETLYQGFFGPALRALADRLDVPVVVGVQDAYTERNDFKGLGGGLLEPYVNIPLLTTADQFALIVDLRLERAKSGITARDICAEDALEKLAEVHSQPPDAGDTRETINVLRAAIAQAASDGSEKVSARHIAAAVAG